MHDQSGLQKWILSLPKSEIPSWILQQIATKATLDWTDVVSRFGLKQSLFLVRVVQKEFNPSEFTISIFSYLLCSLGVSSSAHLLDQCRIPVKSKETDINQLFKQYLESETSQKIKLYGNLLESLIKSENFQTALKIERNPDEACTFDIKSTIYQAKLDSITYGDSLKIPNLSSRADLLDEETFQLIYDTVLTANDLQYREYDEDDSRLPIDVYVDQFPRVTLEVARKLGILHYDSAFKSIQSFRRGDLRPEDYPIIEFSKLFDELLMADGMFVLVTSDDIAAWIRRTKPEVSDGNVQRFVVDVIKWQNCVVGHIQKTCKYLNCGIESPALWDVPSVCCTISLATTFSSITTWDISNIVKSVSGELWIFLMPQLLALIDSGSEINAEFVKTVLSSISKSSSQHIIYHVVSGSLFAKDFVAKSSYESIMTRLTVLGHQGLIDTAQTFIKELIRISVLWEERWWFELSKIASLMARKVKRLEVEVSRIKKEPSLTDEKRNDLFRENYHVILDPIIAILNDLCATTLEVEPATLYETVFQKRYGVLLKTMIECVRNPENFEDPQSAYLSIKNVSILRMYLTLEKVFSELTQSLKGSTAFELCDISPILAKINADILPMPGGDPRTKIQKLETSVHVLATKNRPKKLVFIGTDGLEYTYLLKGMEDLHLDERIQQFIRTASGFLVESLGSEFNCATYSVIPIGPRLGLIQWVENTVSLYNLHRDWRKRVIEASKRDGSFITDHDKLYGNPQNAYNEKLAEISSRPGVQPLKDQVKVKTRVFEELNSEPMPDVVRPTYGYASLDPTLYQKKQEAFRNSLAVMSILGYVLGLGDRHLENILVEKTTGQIIHIDFNVCFEKGRRLKVPEVVPFRLTKILMNALGPFGIQSGFSKSCADTLRVVREHATTLTLLLQMSFWNDPISEWTDESKALYDRALQDANMFVQLLKSTLGNFYTH